MPHTQSLETSLADFATLAAALAAAPVALAAAWSPDAKLLVATTAPLPEAATIPELFAAAGEPQTNIDLRNPARHKQLQPLALSSLAGIHLTKPDGAPLCALYGLNSRPLTRPQQNNLAALARRLAAHVGHLEAVQQQRDAAANTDGLTGIPNRRGFDAALATEWLRARRARSPIALLQLDIDQFRLFNEAEGQPAGDEALRQVAGCLRGSLARAGDVVARFGGDVFAILLPDIDANETGAATVAERCRAAVQALAIPHKASAAGVLTISAGAVTMVPQAQEPARLLQQADSALYMAKDRGRNRICAFGAPVRQRVGVG